MKLLVLGGGGREHALVWRLRQGESVNKLWCSPGNGGIADEAECVAADTRNVAGARRSGGAAGRGPDGGRSGRAAGAGDCGRIRAARAAASGSDEEMRAAEGSKIFAKEFLEQHGIATARALGIYDSADAARAGVRKLQGAMVLKADGLCAGKGVLVTSSAAEAEAFVERAMERREFGDGGARLLVEEALSGPELSFIVLADGETFLPMVPTRDHKRVFDGDRGPNTGGMGAYSTDGMIAPELERQIIETIVRPTLAGLAKDVEPYRGFLYFGLMLTPSGPKVLEFNCRAGRSGNASDHGARGFRSGQRAGGLRGGRVAESRAAMEAGSELVRGDDVGRVSGSVRDGQKDRGSGRSGRHAERGGVSRGDVEGRR